MNNVRKITFEVWLTTATEDYDGFGTVTLQSADKTERFDVQGKPMRMVGIVPDYSDWQITRYGTGMFATMTEEDYAFG